jgi:hypothetical protein
VGILTTHPAEAYDFSNKTCTIDHPPGSTSQDNYRTWPILGRSTGEFAGHVDKNGSDFTWYDIYVKQTVPFVVTASFSGGSSETQVLCVAPKDIVEGSRVPVQRSAAVRIGGSSGWVVMAAAVAVSVVAAAL